MATVKSGKISHIPIENGSLSKFSINHKPIDKYRYCVGAWDEVLFIVCSFLFFYSVFNVHFLV